MEQGYTGSDRTLYRYLAVLQREPRRVAPDKWRKEEGRTILQKKATHAYNEKTEKEVRFSRWEKEWLHT